MGTRRREDVGNQHQKQDRQQEIGSRLHQSKVQTLPSPLHSLLNDFSRDPRKEAPQVRSYAYGHYAQWPAEINPRSVDIRSGILLHIKDKVGGCEHTQAKTKQQQADATICHLVDWSLPSDQ